MAVLIWSIIFAIACGYIANEKGRSSGAWAILGFFFGFFALIVIALLPDKTNKRGY